MRLPRPVLVRLVRTAALMWLAARLAAAALSLSTESLALVTLSPLGSAVLVALASLMCWLDVSATRERLLYANLAVRPAAMNAVIVLVVGGLELVGRISLAALGVGASAGVAP